MPDEETLHKDNLTPLASDEDVERVDADTPDREATGASADRGVRVDTEGGDDPKSGGTPVHPAPTEDRPKS